MERGKGAKEVEKLRQRSSQEQRPRQKVGLEPHTQVSGAGLAFEHEGLEEF